MVKSKNRITIFNVASTVILQGLVFFSAPIFSGVLGTANYGIASVYYTWVQLASTVFSLQAGGTVALAKIHFPEEEQDRYQSSVLGLSTLSYLGFSALTMLVITALSRFFDISVTMSALALLHGWGLYCVTFVNSKFTYEFKAEKNFVLSVTTSALTIAASLFLIYRFPAETNYWGRILGQSVVYTLIGTILFIYIYKNGRTLYNKSYWTFTLPIALPTIFHLLANIVLNQSDRVMLKQMVDNSAAGIYSLAATFGAVINTIWSAFNNSWVPFYYEYTKQGQTDEIRKHARNYMELFTILVMGFILLAREVFHVFARRAFWDGTDLIPLFSIGFYFVFLYSFPVNYEFYNKKTRTIAVGTVMAAICNVILNYLMISLWGIIGAVIATAIAHGIQFLFHYICAGRINPGEFPFRMQDFIPGLLAVSGAAVLYMFTKELWLIRWGLGAALGIYLLAKIIKRREIF